MLLVYDHQNQEQIISFQTIEQREKGNFIELLHMLKNEYIQYNNTAVFKYSNIDFWVNTETNSKVNKFYELIKENFISPLQVKESF